MFPLNKGKVHCIPESILTSYLYVRKRFTTATSKKQNVLISKHGKFIKEYSPKARKVS